MLGDGPWTPNFTAVPLDGNVGFDTLPKAVLSEEILEAAAHAPRGTGAAWGLPFTVDLPILIREFPVAATIPETQAEWLVFMHTSDRRPLTANEDGFFSPMPGEGHLAELAANYVIPYDDGTEVTAPVHRRHQMGAFQRTWGENCFQAVAHQKPRAEHAASIISGDIDALEMTSWGDLYSGISPYSLSDWYRYLNCGYRVAAVGGTDKMSAATAVGTVRTYAKIPDGEPFTYQRWMEAVRRAETFVTYGPLLEFTVDGHPMGSRIRMGYNGGTVDVEWEVASVTVPVSRVELIVNGEIRESVAVDPDHAAGQWSVKVDASAWLALLVRGHYPDKPEIIAAHSSPVMIDVEGSQMLAAADAVTILEQIEGALAYLDTVGTRAEDRAYKRMRMVLESAHRGLHNRMHQQGYYHDHTPVTDHPEHHT
jgi:hypothetical protein